MSNDTQSTGTGGSHGQTPSWAPPGDGWVGSRPAGQQPSHEAHGAPTDPYRSAPTAPQPAAHGQHPTGAGSYGGSSSGPYGAAPTGSPYAGAGTATAAPADAPWYGTPTAPGGPGDGGHSAPGRTGRRGPGWGGVVAIAAVAALIAGGSSVAVARSFDGSAPGISASASAGSGDAGSGSTSSGGSTGSVPLTQAVDWGQVAQSVEPSVVTIQVSNGQTGGEGTGIILDTEGHVVTNNHVATAAGADGQIRIILSDGRVYQGEITGTDPATDLAVIQIQDAPSDLRPATFGDSSAVAVGQPVMAIGNPLGLSDTVTTGIISATDRPVTTQASESDQQEADPFGFNRQQQAQPERVITNALQTDAAINPGNSGGPLVDASGQVIGVNSSIASTSDGSGQAGSIGLGFAIPGNEVNRVASELVQTGSAEHARLGVVLGNDTTATVGNTTRQAAEVTQVPGGTAAEQAGIQQGDLITAVDGRNVSGAESLTAQIRSRAPGDQVTLTVVRGGQESKIPVTLGTSTD